MALINLERIKNNWSFVILFLKKITSFIIINPRNLLELLNRKKNKLEFEKIEVCTSI